ncbi:hypothetical protein B5E53_06995 [Eubacterium sp. An11]|nr:hypothetical protein B5E53_06995 [Eubacterium sp. An11]
MQNIVEFIKNEMAARGMTYDILSEKCGMSRQNLWDKLNKRVYPNFGNVRKILAGLGYELSIEKKMDGREPVQADTEQFFEVAELEQVSYDCIEELLAAMGYELKMKTQQNEEKVKKGIDRLPTRVKL